MALTYRSAKGSALTTDELDNNFRHFTGSHTVTGDLTITDTITAVSGAFGHITASTIDVDANTIRIGGTSFSKDNLDELKAGKPIKQESPIGGFESIVRPEVVMSAVDTTDFQKWTVANRIGTFLNSTLIHDLNFNGSNNYISMGKDSRTQINITGTGKVSNGLEVTGSFSMKSGSFTFGGGELAENINFDNVNFSISGSTTVSGSVSISGSTVINGGTTVTGSVNITGNCY